MITDLNLYARLHGYRNHISLVALSEKNGVLEYAKSVSVEHGEVGGYVEPFMLLNMQQGQHLMDQLWDCGLRPSEGSGSAGALAATQRHLEDMRAMVAHGFTAKLPGVKE